MLDLRQELGMRWVVTSDQAKYMRERQVQNRDKSVAAEDWAECHLKQTGHKWTRQAQWGCRLFDFWCADLGIAIEIDGPDHDEEYDRVRDQYNYFRSGIVVLRVKNFDELDLQRVLEQVKTADTWVTRKQKMRNEYGLSESESFSTILKKVGIPKAHGKWNPKPI